MRKLLNVALIGALAFVLSGCLFTLSGFVILDSSLAPGDSTTARFTLQPFSEEPLRTYAFVLLGVSDSGQASTGKATWGANGNFRGPLTMDVSPGFAGVLDTDGGCTGGGLDFASVVGQFTWKGYVTPVKINNQGDVTARATVDVVLKAKAGASHNTSVNVMALTGLWDDDGDGVPDISDTLLCTGNATTSLYVT